MSTGLGLVWRMLVWSAGLCTCISTGFDWVLVGSSLVWSTALFARMSTGLKRVLSAGLCIRWSTGLDWALVWSTGLCARMEHGSGNGKKKKVGDRG